MHLFLLFSQYLQRLQFLHSLSLYTGQPKEFLTQPNASTLLEAKCSGDENSITSTITPNKSNFIISYYMIYYEKFMKL